MTERLAVGALGKWIDVAVFLKMAGSVEVNKASDRQLATVQFPGVAKTIKERIVD